MKSLKILWLVSLLSAVTSYTCMSPLPPGPVSPGPWPVLTMYSFLKSGEKHKPLGSGHAVFAGHLRDGAALVDAVDRGGQLALVAAELRRLAQARVEAPALVGRAPCIVHRALVELRAVRRVGEPVAAVGMLHHVVGRIQALAVEARRDDRRRSVELVADHASPEVLARQLPALVIEGVAVAVVRRRAEHADAAIVFDPPHLAVVGDVAPHEKLAHRAPSGSLAPQATGPQPLDRRVDLEAAERRVDGEHIGVGEVSGRRAVGAKVARRLRDDARRRHGPARPCACASRGPTRAAPTMATPMRRNSVRRSPLCEDCTPDESSIMLSPVVVVGGGGAHATRLPRPTPAEG